MRTVYFILFLLGTLFPLVCFYMHFSGGFPDAWGKFWAAPFASWVISGFSWDLIITATVATIWMVAETKRLGMGGIPMQIILIFAVGMSCSLPLFLFRRELFLKKPPKI